MQRIWKWFSVCCIPKNINKLFLNTATGSLFCLLLCEANCCYEKPIAAGEKPIRDELLWFSDKQTVLVSEFLWVNRTKSLIQNCLSISFFFYSRLTGSADLLVSRLRTRFGNDLIDKIMFTRAYFSDKPFIQKKRKWF